MRTATWARAPAVSSARAKAQTPTPRRLATSSRKYPDRVAAFALAALPSVPGRAGRPSVVMITSDALRGTSDALRRMSDALRGAQVGRPGARVAGSLRAAGRDDVLGQNLQHRG